MNVKLMNRPLWGSAQLQQFFADEKLATNGRYLISSSSAYVVKINHIYDHYNNINLVLLRFINIYCLTI